MKQNQIEKLSADYVTDSFADIIDLKYKLIKILIPRLSAIFIILVTTANPAAINAALTDESMGSLLI